jgi:hypothetical protein
LLFLIDSFAGTIAYTCRFLAVVARDPLKMNTHKGKVTSFIFIDFQILEGTRGKLIPVLAGHSAGVASGTTALIKKKPCCAIMHPSIF